jgi:hypothetical protein
VPKDLRSYEDRPSRTALLNDRAARTARALQAARWMPLRCWSDKLTSPGGPGRMDYPAEIKRWRAFAEHAGQMARRWEQRT